jgi:hypothetical protein
MKKNIKINLDFKKLFNNYSVMLWLLLGVVLIGVGFKLQTSVSVVSDSLKQDTITIPAGGARVNFQNYDEVVKRIQTGGDYVPSRDSDIDPFSVTVSKSQSTAQ